MVNLHELKVACSSCNLRELCLPLGGLSQPDLERLDSLVATRKAVRRGEVLFSAGAPFDALYAVLKVRALAYGGLTAGG